MWNILTWFKILVPIFLPFVFIVLFIVSVGKTLGMRKKYVEALLRVFEYGREKIEKVERSHNYSSSEEEEDVFPTIPLQNGYSTTVITREGVKLFPEAPVEEEANQNLETFHDQRKDFHLTHAMDFVKAGVEAIIEDEVTKRFSAEELPSWNLLTRTNKNYHYISLKVTILWGIGFFLRYFVFLPFRVTLLWLGVGWLIISNAAIGCLQDGPLKRWAYWHASLMSFRILARALSAVITYHNRENQAKGGGICVANHTSPIDVVMLASDNCYALVGQRQGGFLGLLQRGLARATSHIWFERCEMKDRVIVTQRLKQHVQDQNKLPILIFPEGTCINNTSVMMFKKGSFDVGGTIYPVAIKYDPRFGDAFWDSSKQGYFHYLLMMMTSWAIVCDVWYLKPMTRKEGETAVKFASRVKSEIACKGGLVDLMWDGQLKRMNVKAEWKARQQEEYSRLIKLD